MGLDMYLKARRYLRYDDDRRKSPREEFKQTRRSQQDKGDNGWGYVIATSTQMTNATSTYPAFKQYGLGSAEELVALSILHGMGHLSGIYHGPNGNDGGYMSNGNFLGPMLQNSFEGDINKLIENTKKNYPETMKPILNR